MLVKSNLSDSKIESRNRKLESLGIMFSIFGFLCWCVALGSHERLPDNSIHFLTSLGLQKEF